MSSTPVAVAPVEGPRNPGLPLTPLYRVVERGLALARELDASGIDWARLELRPGGPLEFVSRLNIGFARLHLGLGPEHGDELGDVPKSALVPDRKRYGTGPRAPFPIAWVGIDWVGEGLRLSSWVTQDLSLRRRGAS